MFTQQKVFKSVYFPTVKTCFITLFLRPTLDVFTCLNINNIMDLSYYNLLNKQAAMAELIRVLFSKRDDINTLVGERKKEKYSRINEISPEIRSGSFPNGTVAGNDSERKKSTFLNF